MYEETCFDKAIARGEDLYRHYSVSLFVATINKETNEYRVLDYQNRSYFKGTFQECKDFIDN